MNLSKHFTLQELMTSDIAKRHNLDNTPSQSIINNLTRLALLLEAVRDLLNKPIHVNSAYRSVAVNTLLGSKPTSQHCIGCAADIKVNGLTPELVIKAIVNSNIPYDQVIKEYDSWVHISISAHNHVAPRRQALVIDNKGTKPYL